MIDKTIFQTSRELARALLPPDEARNSYSYYIDIPNVWETYRAPEDLIDWFGIHSTHVAQFAELTQNLGALSPEEMNWAARYAAFFDMASKMLSTTGYRTDLRYDIAETMSDWRNILRFKALPAKILDFGAGCGRQGVAAFLRDGDNIYTAVDGTLAAYTVQNFVFGLIDAATDGSATVDLLDFEAALKPMPRIADAAPGSRYHVPVWMIEKLLPERFYDIIIAAHVHNELSGYDFMRLVRCIDRGLADDGIAYVRSELYAIDPRDYFDTIDLHALEIVPLLREMGIVPIYAEHDTYLTTVFARENSPAHRRAAQNGDTGYELLAARRNRDVSLGAGQRFVARKLRELAAAGSRALVVADEGEQFFEQMVRPALAKMAGSEIVSPAAFAGRTADREIKDFDADVVIICSHDAGRLEGIAYDILGKAQFPLRLHYFYPIFFLLRGHQVRRQSIFDHPIRTASDVDAAAAPRLHELFPRSGRTVPSH